MKELCVYCGDEKATETIFNPNDGNDEKEPFWRVCKDCKDTIRAQQELCFGTLLENMDDEVAQRHGRKVVVKAYKTIERIAKKTNKPIVCASITRNKQKKYEVNSITYTGASE